MPLDAICLSALRFELAEVLKGRKIDKIQQPERDLLVLSLRGMDGITHRLLISTGSNDTRVHLTNHKFDNPQTPPMFCMLLRKHLSGAKITDLFQPSGERILTFKMEASDAIGFKSEKCLIIEMIGNQSNIVLIDCNGLIIDCLRRIGGSFDEKRIVLPGLVYQAPPSQKGKLNPLCIDAKLFDELLPALSEQTIEKWLISTFIAFSPLICREIAWRSYGETDYRLNEITDSGTSLKNEFFSLIKKIKVNGFEPWLINMDNGKPYDFSYTKIKQYETKFKAVLEKNFSTLLENYFTRASNENRIKLRSQGLLKSITNTKDRLIRKLALQKTELAETTKRDYFRQCGDLISANYHLIKRGQELLKAEDFYADNGEFREIKLDPYKSPQQNSAKYYKAYSKAKNAQKVLALQIEKGENELEYVKSVIEQLQRAENEQDLNEIRKELTLTGYIKEKKSNKKQKQKQTDTSPMQFYSTSGMLILAGRNNIQNDKITMKTASKNDLWFHAQKISGAHVIIVTAGSAPDKKSYEEAAAIAAYYSAGRDEKKVTVDYTLVKNVKKPSGSRPGMVIYHDFKSIITVPNEEIVKRLRV